MSLLSTTKDYVVSGNNVKLARLATESIHIGGELHPKGADFGNFCAQHGQWLPYVGFGQWSGLGDSAHWLLQSAVWFEDPRGDHLMAHPFPGMWLKSPAINAHSQPRGARAAATTQEKKADFPPALLIMVLLRFFNRQIYVNWAATLRNFTPRQLRTWQNKWHSRTQLELVIGPMNLFLKIQIFKRPTTTSKSQFYAPHATGSGGYIF